MAVANYASVADLGQYLTDVNQLQNGPIWTTFLGMASRFIDIQCGQYFYADGQRVRYFDGGASRIDTGNHPFWHKSGTIAACAQGATSLTYTASVVNPVAPVAGDVFTLDVATTQESVTVSAVAGTGPYTLTV